MAKSPALEHDGVLRLTIRSGGTAIDQSIRVVAVEVHESADRIPCARIVILDGDTPGEGFTLSDSEAFEPGAAITIGAGYGDQEEEIFSGVVVRHGIEITGDDGARMVVDCLDSAAGGTVGEKAPAAGAEAVLSVTYGAGLLEFHAETDARTQRAADRRQSQSASPALRGRMKFQGSARVRPGVLITVAGVGARFSGHVSVTTVRHEIRDGNWITEAGFGTAAEAGVPAAAVIAPGTDGAGVKIEHDDARKIITITTPAAGTIVIAEDGGSIQLQDQNSNRVTLGPGGISLESPKDIRLDAKGKVTISAAGNIEMTAQADVRVTGVNIVQHAGIGLTATGTATAELSAGGQTTVKGAIVMIN
jgi:hypothetical protein